jgi:putative transposase
MVDRSHLSLSIVRQCALLSISRSRYYGPVRGESAENLALMRVIDAQFLETPWYGSRQMTHHLRRQGHVVNRKRVRRLMSRMGLAAIYQRPKTSVPHPEHKIWPYLLRDLTIDRPNQVWCTDITYIPMRRGFLYLIAMMDWASRRVLAWKLSNSMDIDFCLEVPQEAMARHGKPEIVNTDQGGQFTSPKFTGILTDAGIKVSMDGRGRWMDNVFIERLWRSLKYECVYLHAFETGSEPGPVSDAGSITTIPNALIPRSGDKHRTRHTGNGRTDCVWRRELIRTKLNAEQKLSAHGGPALFISASCRVKPSRGS